MSGLDTAKIRKYWNISILTVEPGQTVAFCWTKWGWKDNARELIAPRFYELKEGEILIDGTNITHLTVSSPTNRYRARCVPVMERDS